MEQAYYKRDFWLGENLKYARPHYRLEKAARIVNAIAQGKDCDLLDVGCGPATLMHRLDTNIHYYGIDIAIQKPAPNLIQMDFLENPIRYDTKKFDIIVAQGIFEYAGQFQADKFGEIASLLKQNGTFVASYVNFNHRDKRIYPPYNNVQPFDVFQRSMRRFFCIDRTVPTSHHWHHHEPNRQFMKFIQLNINLNIPFISRWLAVEYFLLCSKKLSEA